MDTTYKAYDLYSVLPSVPTHYHYQQTGKQVDPSNSFLLAPPGSGTIPTQLGARDPGIGI
ncbi:hypothetical protein VTH06DRAFT_4679 [Thermothelomyces fergusii]